MITLVIPDEVAEELTAQLKLIEGINIEVSRPRINEGDFVERTFKSDTSMLAIITIAVVGRIAPKVIEALRDIIIEYLRSRRKSIIVKLPDGTETAYFGTYNKEELKKVTNEITTMLTSGG